MDIDKIYEQIDIISDKALKDDNDLDYLIQYSTCDDSEVRSYIAEILVAFDCEKAEKTLLTMCTDEDELVRINACDSLSVYSSKEVYLKLLDVFKNDMSLLVKNYALLSIIDVMQSINIDKLEVKILFYDCLEKYDDQIKVTAYKGLYILYNENCLDEILKMLAHSEYAIRCNVINVLYDIITPFNEEKIISTLIKCKETEKSEAVLAEINEFLVTHNSDDMQQKH